MKSVKMSTIPVVNTDRLVWIQMNTDNTIIFKSELKENKNESYNDESISNTFSIPTTD